MRGAPPDQDRPTAYGLPRGRLVRLALYGAGVAAVAADRLWLGGAIFGSVAWRLALWGVVGCGLAIGLFAFLRRDG